MQAAVSPERRRTRRPAALLTIVALVLSMLATTVGVADAQAARIKSRAATFDPEETVTCLSMT